MKPIQSCYLLIFSFLLFSCTNNEPAESLLKATSGRYLGEMVPKDSAVIFSANLISTEFNERDAAFSADGNDFFYSIKGPSFYSIIHVERKDNIWQKPEVASFSGKYSDIEPCFSPDGSKLFFVSNRPLNEDGEPKDYDIWFVQKDSSGWGIPSNLGAPINTFANEFYPSFSKEETIYFCASYENGKGGEDLYYSELKDGSYQTPINMGDSINTSNDEFNAFVSPDEKFIIFTSTGWGKGFGGGDLWISFKNSSKNWTKPKNMGEKVNSQFLEYCPSLTPDGKYLFFTSNKNNVEDFSPTPLTYINITDGLRSTLNGGQNLYWISTDFIMSLE